MRALNILILGNKSINFLMPCLNNRKRNCLYKYFYSEFQHGTCAGPCRVHKNIKLTFKEFKFRILYANSKDINVITLRHDLYVSI